MTSGRVTNSSKSFPRLGSGARNGGENNVPEPLVARLYLPKDVRNGILAGERVFYTKLLSVLERAGFRVDLHSDSVHEVIKARRRRGHSVFLMQEPVNRYGVTIRQNYFYPFWNIQECAKRWNWPVAKAVFHPDSLSAQEASTFFHYWRGRIFGPTAEHTTRSGFVLVPLQGKLFAQRSFQECSPLHMLEYVLAYDQERKVIATLHPKETYSKRELGALDTLRNRNKRLSFGTKSTETYLRACDYIVTENSSVALSGFFFRKPATLFGRIDFHHIAANVRTLGVETALESAPRLEPEYEKYLWWFFRHMSINVQSPDAEQRIRTALREAGWPI